MEGSCRISKGRRRSAMVAGGCSRRRWGSGGQRSMGSVSPAPSRRGGHDGGIDWLQRTTEAVKHAAAANSACGFRRSGCSGREARGGGGRTRARVARPRRFIGAGRSRAGHGRLVAAKRRTPAESCTERTAAGPRWVPRAGSGSGWCGPGSGCGLRSNCGRRRS
jgi:hypothetical protein